MFQPAFGVSIKVGLGLRLGGPSDAREIGFIFYPAFVCQQQFIRDQRGLNLAEVHALYWMPF